MNNKRVREVLLACCCFIPGLLSSAAVAAPLTGDQLNQAVPVHGNFCGPGWSNGKWISGGEKDLCRPGSRLLSAEDKLDSLCLIHDRDYCGKDRAKEDEADKRFISGLTGLNASLHNEWTANKCAETEKQPEAQSTLVMGKDLTAKTGEAVARPAFLASVLDLVRNSAKKTETCEKLRSQLAYTTAAIPAFKLKRALYQKAMAKKAALAKSAK